MAMLNGIKCKKFLFINRGGETGMLEWIYQIYLLTHPFLIPSNRTLNTLSSLQLEKYNGEGYFIFSKCSSNHLAQLEKAQMQKQRPTTAKTKIKKKKINLKKVKVAMITIIDSTAEAIIRMAVGHTDPRNKLPTKFPVNKALLKYP